MNRILRLRVSFVKETTYAPFTVLRAFLKIIALTFYYFSLYLSAAHRYCHFCCFYRKECLTRKKTSKKDFGNYNEVNWMTFVSLIDEYGHFS